MLLEEPDPRTAIARRALHPSSYDPSTIRERLEAEEVEIRAVASPAELDPENTLAAFILNSESRDEYGPTVLRQFVEAGGSIVALGAPDEADVPSTLSTDLLTSFLRAPIGLEQLLLSIRAAWASSHVEQLVEGFVRASLHAIEQRDPTTFTHAYRVADLAVRLAQAADQVTRGPLRDVHFSQNQIRAIRYASLLLDIGNVAVREDVLMKAKKLYPPDLALILQRISVMRGLREVGYLRKRVEYVEQHGHEGYDAFVRQLSEEHQRQLTDLDRFTELVSKCNEPTVLPEGGFKDLLRYADSYYLDLDGSVKPYLTEDEVRFLTIRVGSLDESERFAIESHATHTYQFLRKIPWTRELADVPAMAYEHHEKLDGSGYPRRLRGDQIPIQTRIVTIADIYAALTSANRPYRNRLSPERALEIMTNEVQQGQLDAELFRLFVESEAFEDPAAYSA
jgi:HD-GYP domain-containing protein (c-di-GMP phosphodiesterase class II)